jgi:hypothetical protein
VSGVLARLRANEPVRVILYPALVVVAGAVAVDASVSPAVNAVVQLAVAGVALLLGIPAIEAARARVTPAGRVAEQAVDVARTVQQKAEGGVTAEEAVDIAADVVEAANKVTPLGPLNPVVQEVLRRAREQARYFDRGEHRAP